MYKIEEIINKVHNADCLEFMKQMPDKCVDLVLTDPPYGIGADKGTAGVGTVAWRQYDDDWDNSTPPQEIFDEILRVSKVAIIFGGQFFTDKLPPNGHWIVWDKKGDIEFENNFGDCELAWTNINRHSVKKYKVIQQGFIAAEKTRWHPTQKPVQLFASIMQDYLDSDLIVLDPFLGSGTTAVAAKQLGRNFIGVEISKKYCDIANERLRQDILL